MSILDCIWIKLGKREDWEKKKKTVSAGTNECIEREGEGGETQCFSQLPCRLNTMSSAPRTKWSQFAPASNGAGSQLAEALAGP